MRTGSSTQLMNAPNNVPGGRQRIGPPISAVHDIEGHDAGSLRRTFSTVSFCSAARSGATSSASTDLHRATSSTARPTRLSADRVCTKYGKPILDTRRVRYGIDIYDGLRSPCSRCGLDAVLQPRR